MVFRRIIDGPFGVFFVRVGGSYNQLLLDYPIITKSITSGFMYAAGDMICQVGEAATSNKPLKVDWKRVGVMAAFGTFISGPVYHYWFAYLDVLPIRMLELRKLRERWQVLRALNVLKQHNIDVGELALPETKPFSKRTIKACKIFMDQAVFSSLYTLGFFMGVGTLNHMVGVGEKKEEEVVENETHTAAGHELTSVINSLHTMKTENNSDAIDNIIKKLEASHSSGIHLRLPSLPFVSAVKQAWDHTKAVYLRTYAVDCVVWPPLQLINFSFVPLRYQVLYVNICNLGWNTFLSFMANGAH